MICNNCKQELPDTATFCSNCGEMISEENKKHISTKPKRENIDIIGVKLPILYISIFAVILGYGGYITPLLLMIGVLLLAKVENQTLTSNFLVILGLYAVQFTFDTCLTFIESIPVKFLYWLQSFFKDIDAIATIGNIIYGVNNVFDVISTMIGLVFFAMYILSIISLFKSDKIRIPFVNDIFKKYFK